MAQKKGNHAIKQDDLRRDDLRRRVLERASPIISAEGLSSLSAERLAQKTDMSAAEIRLCFERLAPDLADFYLSEGDRLMIEKAQSQKLPEKTSDKIAALIWLRLEIDGGDKNLAKRILAFFSLAPFWASGLSHLARTCDHIWRLAGDKSSDFSFYSKRMVLGVIYHQALLFYLSTDDKTRAQNFIKDKITQMGAPMTLLRDFYDTIYPSRPSSHSSHSPDKPHSSPSPHASQEAKAR